jgi:F-type H+-transporting ATPase subunit alpha
MNGQTSDLVYLFENALKGSSPEHLDQTGIVVRVGDGICIIHGLTHAIFGELIEFEGGNKGIIFDMDADSVSVFLLESSIAVPELEVARRTGHVYKTPVGMNFLGRIISALSVPLDGKGEIHAEEFKPIETTIASIIERSPVNQPLQTGILIVDALVPIGRGQRELIIGNRSTGKTALILDTIINQKDKNVLCVYVSIGQRQAHIAQLWQLLEQHGALEYTTIVSAESSEAVVNQYLAPYVGCTIAEYYRDKGHDVLIIYDDLTSHAIAFRQMSLLMRRAPGREAFPGDVFYLHSRLLERAGKLARGGSITALPVVQTQSDDITAYIPTNLISITDGQIFLDTKLFNQGIRPAVNAELSISRVGGAAQTPAMKKMTRALRLELAQFHELQDFAQFGTELDALSQQRLSRGQRVIELFKQPELSPYSVTDQVLMLFLFKENFLDTVPVSKVQEYALQFVSFVRMVHGSLYQQISEAQDFSELNLVSLREVGNTFMRMNGYQ